MGFGGWGIREKEGNHVPLSQWTNPHSCTGVCSPLRAHGTSMTNPRGAVSTQSHFEELHLLSTLKGEKPPRDLKDNILSLHI